MDLFKNNLEKSPSDASKRIRKLIRKIIRLKTGDISDDGDGNRKEFSKSHSWLVRCFHFIEHTVNLFYKIVRHSANLHIALRPLKNHIVEVWVED